MENMSIRKIKIIPKHLFDLPAILEDLGVNCIEINLEGTKEQVKYLCSSSLIEDWDFIEDKPKPSLPEEDTEFSVDDYEGLAYFLEKTFKIYKESPSIGFRSTPFKTKFEKLQSGTLVDHALITMILKTQYQEWNWKDVEEDFFNRVEKSWKSKSINTCSTLSEFIKHLYGK